MRYNQSSLPEQYGFINTPTASLVSKSILLRDLRALLDTTGSKATYNELREQALIHNCLQKSSQSGRLNTFRRLREFYGLNRDEPVFNSMQLLWANSVMEQPLLAILCAAARNPILRESFAVIQAVPQGEPVTKEHLLVELSSSFPENYSDKSKEMVISNLLSSWAQSGHLTGKSKRVRTKPTAGPVSASYALYLGYLAGNYGDLLFNTLWMSILVLPTDESRELAHQAFAKGLITYRSAGGITDIDFPLFPKPVD